MNSLTLFIFFCGIQSLTFAYFPIEKFDVKYEFRFEKQDLNGLCKNEGFGYTDINLRRHNNSIAYKIARHACGKIDIHDPAQAEIINLGNDENGKVRTAVLVKSLNEKHQQENEEARLLTFDLGPYMKYFNVTSENGEPKIFYDTIEFEHGTCNTTINVTDVQIRRDLLKVVEIKAINGTCHSFKHLQNSSTYKYCPYAEKEIVGIDASYLFAYDKTWKEFQSIKKITKIDVLNKGEVRSLVKELAVVNYGQAPLMGEEELVEDIHWNSDNYCF